MAIDSTAMASAMTLAANTQLNFVDLAPLFEVLPVAVAVFDATERLVLCNNIFRTNQGPQISPFITPGITFSKMLDLQIRFGTYPKTDGGAKAWRAQRIAAFQSENSVRLINWPHLGWYEIHDRRLPNGYAVTVGTDITVVEDHAEQLQSLQQRLMDYVNVASDWFWESDADHRMTFLSDRFIATTGLDPDALIGEEIRNIARRSEDTQSWSAHLDDLNAHQPFRDFRYSMRVGDDRKVDVSINGQPVFDSDGQFTGYRGTGVNVTQEVEGQRASERFLAAIESVSDGYSLWDKNDKLIVCNSRCRELTRLTSTYPLEPGLDYETHIRDNVRNGAFPVALKDPESWIRKRVHRHRHNKEAFELQRDNGRWLLVQERRTLEGGILQILRDISDLKRRGIELRASEERFKGFAESAADWFWELDCEFCITFVSARYMQLTGKSIDELIGKNFRNLASDDDHHQKAIAEAVHKLRSGVVLHEHEIHAPTCDGNTVVHSLGGQSIRDSEGNITGYRGTGRDVTQARLLSTQLEHQASHDDLTGLVNRRGFEQRLARAMESVQNGRSQYALC
jgi:PAS domain S-box-containing protein